eukprot:gene8860-10875_t
MNGCTADCVDISRRILQSRPLLPMNYFTEPTNHSAPFRMSALLKVCNSRHLSLIWTTPDMRASCAQSLRARVVPSALTMFWSQGRPLHGL